MRWALVKRKPWFHLLFDTVRRFLPVNALVPEREEPPRWLRPSFAKRNRLALRGYETRLNLFGALPSFQENLLTMDALRRQMACSPLSYQPLLEKRYPYLDRNLIEFLFALPREQLLRPGQRRSLMRRALVGTVPSEILERRRKAYVARAPMAAIATQWAILKEMTQNMVSDSLGVVDEKQIQETLEKARNGQDIPMVSLIRTLQVESWLQMHKHHYWLNLPESRLSTPPLETVLGGGAYTNNSKE
jgi:asparagine synthase (glutamine-hydrolysing)